MKRRTFCKVTLGGAALSAPMAKLVAATADQAAPVATEIQALKSSGQATVIEKAALDEFSGSLRGDVILPDNAEYETARRIWNRMIDKRPAMIVRCAGAADVANAITFARERELVLAVRGGGHSFPGYSTCDGGMLLDLSLMKTVRVDLKGRTAVAAAGAWGRDVDAETQHYELVTTLGQISDTGIAGLTLGGGFGWLSRKHGLACDNLVSVDVVTADGQLRRASSDENPDLFWGLRGGGGNFGVATSFEYRLHPLSRQVAGGGVAWQRSDARAVCEYYADMVANGPRELSLDLSVNASRKFGSLIGIDACYAGDPATGMKLFEHMRRVGKPVDVRVGVTKYTDLQRQFDDPHLSPNYHYLKGGFLREFTPAFVDFLARGFQPRKHVNIYMQNSSGAVGDVAPGATAFWNRKSIANLMIMGAWSDPAENDSNRADIRAAWEQTAPFTEGTYVNLNDAEKNTAAKTYGGNYARLAELKKRYDPRNLFRLNSNVQPSV